jgi:tetratricopeptide (TPR) repeat protein
MQKISFLLISFICITFLGYAQKIDKQALKFDYIQLPNTPLDKAIKNCNSTVILAYEDAVNAEKQEAQNEFEQAKAEYPQKVAEAEDAHAQRMEQYKAAKAEWDKKSGAAKFFEKQILEENNKPVEPTYHKPAPPVLRNVATQKVFNKDLLATSYLKLGGFASSDDNAVKITVTLYGFENIEPELKQREDAVYNTQTRSTQRTTVYWYEVRYKHPIGIKVESPTGEVLMDEIPQQFSEYQMVKASNQGFNKRTFLESLENKIVEANMKEVSKILNDRYGYVKTNRESTIYRIEPKKFDYDDFQQAYENAVAAYGVLISNNAAATQKLDAACELWEKALTEYVAGDKKARINEDIAIVTRFNLAEAYLFTNNFDKAEAHLSKIISLNPSGKEKKLVGELRDLIKNAKERWEANN